MFLFLVDNKVLNFWGNKVGDVFVENTIANLSLPKDKVKVLFFPLLKDKPELFKISGIDLIKQKKRSNSGGKCIRRWLSRSISGREYSK